MYKKYLLACVIALAGCRANIKEPTMLNGTESSIPAGKYTGELWSNGIRVATTEFFGEMRGDLVGAYTFDVGDDRENGALSRCVPLEAVRSDSYGEGDLHLVFSKDFSSFEGVWSDENNRRSLELRWNGAKSP
jgi:hypothetical protein